MRPLVLFRLMCLLSVFVCLDLCGYLCACAYVYWIYLFVHMPPGNTHSASLVAGLGAWRRDNITSVSLPDLTTPCQSGQLQSGWRCLVYNCRDLVGSGKIAVFSVAIVHTDLGL